MALLVFEMPAAACLKTTAVGAVVVLDAIPTKMKPVSLRARLERAIQLVPTEAALGKDGVGWIFLTMRSGSTFLNPAPLFALNVVLRVVRTAEVLRRVCRLVMTVSVTVWSG